MTTIKLSQERRELLKERYENNKIIALADVGGLICEIYREDCDCYCLIGAIAKEKEIPKLIDEANKSPDDPFVWNNFCKEVFQNAQIKDYYIYGLHDNANRSESHKQRLINVIESLINTGEAEI